jgi:hypothetical protein
MNPNWESVRKPALERFPELRHLRRVNAAALKSFDFHSLRSVALTGRAGTRRLTFFHVESPGRRVAGGKTCAMVSSIISSESLWCALPSTSFWPARLDQTFGLSVEELRGILLRAGRPRASISDRPASLALHGRESARVPGP